MKSKATVKILLDGLMLLALLILMGFQFWGDAVHEWIGAGLFVLVIVHQLLNWHWYGGLFQRKPTAVGICRLFVNLLLLITMLALMYSGIVISRYTFDFLEIHGGVRLARQLHVLASHWAFILMSIHLGLHWRMVMGMVKKHIGITGLSSVRTVLLFVIGLSIAVYGMYAFVKRDFLTYLLLRSEFVFLDYSETGVEFYLDYLALIGLCVFVVYYLDKLLRKRNKMQK